MKVGQDFFPCICRARRTQFSSVSIFTGYLDQGTLMKEYM